ncbi:hypothetical protein RB195_001018 [Necator americanus]|uniref:Uncharacterized protein n=1 Tax=Necator americanus TaxID=51031 RepID=A0ABR1DDN6_NECAM
MVEKERKAMLRYADVTFCAEVGDWFIHSSSTPPYLKHVRVRYANFRHVLRVQSNSPGAFVCFTVAKLSCMLLSHLSPVSAMKRTMHAPRMSRKKVGDNGGEFN